MRLVDLPILTVWHLLGGGPLRHGRGRAFWRGGDGFNVAVDLDRNAWYDHATGSGGGPLRLVQVALGVDRPAALRWLEDHCGLDPLQRPSDEEVRRRRREFAQVEARARVLAAVRRHIEQVLMDAERLAVRAYHVAIAKITNGTFAGETLAELMAEAEAQEGAMLWFQDARDVISRANWDQWADAAECLGVKL